MKKSQNLIGFVAVIFFVSAFYVFSAAFFARADNITATVTVSNGDPLVSSVELNGGSSSISLTEGTYTSVYCTGTITDINGGSDISSATATIYRSGATSTTGCTAENNSCYQLSSSNCSLGSASGNDKSVSCSTTIWFHADPTDSGAYAAQTWACRITGKDASNGVGSGSDATPPEMNSLAALDITASIAYGTIDASTTPANVSILTTVTTTGNVWIDTYLSGSDMSDGSGHTVGAGYERYATSTVAWNDAIALTSSSVALVLAGGKPTTNPSNASASIYWGILIPGGQAAGSYTGSVTSTAVAH